MKNKKFTNLIMLMLILISTFFLIYLLAFSSILRNEIWVLVSFFVNITFSIIMIFKTDQFPYSFKKVFWIFNFIFLSLLPTLQFLYNKQPWLDLSGEFTNSLYLYTNLLISLWFASFFIGSRLKTSYSISQYNAEKTILLKFTSVGLVSIYIQTLLFILVYYVMKYQLDVSFVQSLKLLFFSTLKGIIVFGLTFLVFEFMKYPTKKYLFFLLSILLMYLFLAAPIGGGGRHYLAVVFFGLFLTYHRVLKKQLYFISMLLGSLIIFPFIGQIRNNKTIYDIDFVGRDTLSIVSSGDFDAYTMFMNIIKFVELNGLEYGKQLLGALLFFIPRSVWSDKPIGTGAYIAESYNYYFKNLSAPLIGEFYINFGIIGIAVFGMVLGIFLNKIDKQYWYSINFDNYKYLYFVYPFLIMFFFFMLRGDLLSSYAYIFGFTVATYSIYYFSKKYYAKKIIIKRL